MYDYNNFQGRSVTYYRHIDRIIRSKSRASLKFLISYHNQNLNLQKIPIITFLILLPYRGCTISLNFFIKI